MKPHLYFRDGLWWCFNEQRCVSGLTPEQAYRRLLLWSATEAN